jgi:hypothetical protein
MIQLRTNTILITALKRYEAEQGRDADGYAGNSYQCAQLSAQSIAN